jgi:soluble lytic murein transglycosylase-like protein
VSSFNDYKDLIQSVASQRGYDPARLAAQVDQESGFNKEKLNASGAKGLMQFMAANAKEYGLIRLDAAGKTVDHRGDPRASLDAGVRRMENFEGRYAAFNHDKHAFALAAYNSAPNVVDKAIRAVQASGASVDWATVRDASWVDMKGRSHYYLPKETREYVDNVQSKEMDYSARYANPDKSVTEVKAPTDSYAASISELLSKTLDLQKEPSPPAASPNLGITNIPSGNGGPSL